MFARIGTALSLDEVGLRWRDDLGSSHDDSLRLSPRALLQNLARPLNGLRRGVCCPTQMANIWRC